MARDAVQLEIGIVSFVKNDTAPGLYLLYIETLNPIYVARKNSSTYYKYYII